MCKTVYLEQVDSYASGRIREVLEKIFSQIGANGDLFRSGPSVIVKPNLISKRFASQTNPVLTVEIAKLVREYGSKVSIADSPAWGSIKGNAIGTGLYQLAEQAGIPIYELNHPHRIRGAASQSLHISRQVLEADMVINVPKLKAHVQMKLSGGIKNMFGCVPGKRKAYWHFREGETMRFANMIIDTYKVINPAITIIDAVEAMEGFGPISGNLKHIGAMIASTDGFAADLAACRIVDCDPDSVPVLQAARQRNLLPEKIDIVGEEINNLRIYDFDFPELIPVRFSLIRVIKSIMKQVWKKRSEGRDYQ